MRGLWARGYAWWYHRRRRAQGVPQASWQRAVAMLLVIGGWLGGATMGGVVGWRYGQCQVPPDAVLRIRDELHRRLAGLGTAQIGVQAASAAGRRLATEEAVLRQQLAALAAVPAGARPPVWATLTQCPAVWVDSLTPDDEAR